MPVIGFHNSHEQLHPAALLTAVQHAEEVGFTAAMCSDHIAPWNAEQGHSCFSWSWLGAAMTTTYMPFGAVNAPGQRYHPAIVAQAVATLGAMFPGRFWVALGSGEAMNEHITGDRWPRKDVRDARLRECIDVIRALLAGEEVTHEGLVTVDRARIWTRPEQPPALIAPYRDAGGRGKLVLQLHLSYDPDPDRALAIAHEEWHSNVFPAPLCWDLDSPQAFEQASAHVKPEDVAQVVRVS